MSAYRTTLPERTRPVDERDFDALADGVSFGKIAVRNGIDSDNIDFWNHHIPYHPEDIVRLMEKNFRQNLYVDFIFNDRSNYLAIDFKQRADRGFTASLALQGYPVKEYNDCEITVENDFQGQGHGKGWLKTMVELCAAFGLPAFQYEAGGDNGAYTWAKAGVYLDIGRGDDCLVSALSNQLGRRLEAVRDFVPPDKFDEVRALCALGQKDDLVKLAAMPLDLPGNVLAFPRVADSLASHFNGVPSLSLGSCRTLSEDRGAISKAFERASAQGKICSLPRYLLAGGYWPAIVDFSDSIQMQAIGNYVGGWSAIEPVHRVEKIPAMTAGIR